MKSIHALKLVLISVGLYHLINASISLLTGLPFILPSIQYKGLVMALVPFIYDILIGYFFAFRSTDLIRIFKLESQLGNSELHLNEGQFKPLLIVILVSMGLWLIVQSIPDILAHLLHYLGAADDFGSSPKYLYGELMRFVLGGFILYKFRSIVQWIEEKNSDFRSGD